MDGIWKLKINYGVYEENTHVEWEWMKITKGFRILKLKQQKNLHSKK
jgi:hypothetical protein